MVPERVTFSAADGVGLEGEVAGPPDARVAAVLCHPHPQYGGSMRSLVIGELFAALPAAGVRCLRFNFRGVEGSGGAWDEGRGERLDVAAALESLAATLAPEVPLALVGWSFGADMALSTRDPRVAGWCAIAPPLRSAGVTEGLATDPRPKWLLLAEHDEVRAPAEIVVIAAGWANTVTEVVPGASHFFMGRTDRLVELATKLLRTLT
jgi:alpha/beta superfamily hydrolase